VTSASDSSDTPAQLLIWDTSPLHHAIRADKIDILGDMARTRQGVPRRNLTTQAVTDEISRYQLPLVGLDWLEIQHVDHLDELAALVKWMDLVSGGKSNQGEATVLAWAEVHNAVAVIDDKDAHRIGRAAGLEVWGSLRVIAESVLDGRSTAYMATTLVDALIDTGARYPCPRGQFITWAKENNLL
jgi:predicted nucleic acid-binding protein